MKAVTNIRVSVITVNLNNREGLQKTIHSVIGQTYPNIEYIVIDGASTDGSVKIIDDNVSNIHLWRSEADSGIYDAMNKGIELATGDYLIFLNSGDYFFSPDSVELFAAQNNNSDIVYGNIEIVEADKNWIKTYPQKLSFSYFLGDSLPHPGSFIKKNVFEKIGLYQINIGIVSDWALFVKSICQYNCSYQYLPFTVSSFLYNGISSLPENKKMMDLEKANFLQSNFRLFMDDYSAMEDLKNTYGGFRYSRLGKFISRFIKELPA